MTSRTLANIVKGMRMMVLGCVQQHGFKVMQTVKEDLGIPAIQRSKITVQPRKLTWQ